MTLEILLIDALLGLGAGLACVRAEPAILARRWMGLKSESYDTYGPVKRFLLRGMECLPCSSFWITGMLTLNWKAMFIVLIPAYLFDRWG
jgi:hypothetical protein